jgi:hypothetical protein
MRINDIVGLLAALIGSTATLLGAWGYVRSQHPPKKELFRVSLAIAIIMLSIVGIAVGISRATTITVNGQNTVPIPGFKTPYNATPAPGLPSTPVTSQTPPSFSTPVTSQTPAANNGQPE